MFNDQRFPDIAPQENPQPMQTQDLVQGHPWIGPQAACIMKVSAKRFSA
jgi:hypothetical protein